MNKNQDDMQEKYDLDPSDLIGKHFGSQTEMLEKKKTNKTPVEKISQKDALADLTDRLEKELNGSDYSKVIDMTDRQKDEEVKKPEEKAEDLPKDLLPDQDLEPEHELKEQKKIEPLKKDKQKEKKKTSASWRKEKKREKEQKKKDALRQAQDEKERKKRLEEQAQQKREQEKQIKLEAKAQRQAEHQQLKQEKKERQKAMKLKWEEDRQRKKLIKAQIKEDERKNKFDYASQKKIRPKLSWGWYINVIKRPVLYLVAIEFLVYFFSLITLLESFLLNIVLPLVFILDIIIFGWLIIKVKKILKQNTWSAVKACILAGALVGLARAIFKIIWINEPWTILNIMVEPITIGIIAGIVGVVISLFIKKTK